MANRAQLREWVREQTLLETDDIPNELLNDWLDQAIYEIASRFDWPWTASSFTIDTVAGQAAYDIPSDVGRIEIIVDTDARRALTEESASAIWRRYGGLPPSGTPTCFYVWGSTLNLVPTPSATETDAYTAYHYGAPALMTDDTDTPPFDARFHRVTAFYAMGLAWEREEDYPKAEKAFFDFSDGVDRMARFYLDRANDQPMIFGANKGRTRSIRDLLEETGG